MLKNTHLKLGIGIAAMVLCAALVFQLRTEHKMNLSLPSRRINELSKLYTDKRLQLEKFQRENQYLRAQLQNYDHDQEILRLKSTAGLVPLTGPGLQITLSDAEKRPNEGDDPEFFIVHYYILEELINELRVAGAEAFAVNHNRVITTSGFSCAGTTILVDTKRLAPPYLIDVIGNPENLRRALMIHGGVVENEILAFNLKFDIKVVNKTTVPAYAGNVSFAHAKPLEMEKK